MKAKASLFKDITLEQSTSLIASVGHEVTMLLQGQMGIGKSAILKSLATMFPTHKACYVDITTKDVGDFIIPKIRTVDGVDMCSFIPNEEFGLHLVDTPVIMMLDELGKAKGGVMNACLRLMYERQLGMYKLHPKSIVFATTNLAEEGIGDNVPPHARNRIVCIKVAKPTAEQWIQDFALHNDVDPVIMSAVKEYPDMLASFEEYERPDQNPYIFDPRTPRTSFVTHRSMTTASRIFKATKHLPESVMCHALIGTVGEAATHNILTMMRLDNDAPTWEEIIANPTKCTVPKNAASTCMLVMKAVQRVEKDTMVIWMKYMKRMSKEAQGLFSRSIASKKCPKRDMAIEHTEFSLWAHENQYVFASS